MKNLQILIMCCFLVLLTACGREGGTAQTPVASEEITESITQMPDEQESEAMPENMELGITVNDVYYPKRGQIGPYPKMGRRSCRVGPSSGSWKKTGCC